MRDGVGCMNHLPETAAAVVDNLLALGAELCQTDGFPPWIATSKLGVHV
jgi:hypothetical protein